MSHSLSRSVLGCLLVLGLAATPAPARAQNSVHITFLWHLEQPIYWPAPNTSGQRYQTVWDSMQVKSGGAAHPENDLNEIFGKDDRVAIYQWRVRDAVQTMHGLPHAGVQLTYSGGLIENIASLGAAGQLGYTPSWGEPLRQARGMQTQGGHPRLDIVQFPFHHALLPLVDPEVARMELSVYRAAYTPTWGSGPVSRGLFPSEMAFAEHLIPVLNASGIAWVIVSNAHLSRACQDYPYVAGSGGDNIPPPNRADVRNPAQGHYNRIKIDRGVAPANAVPFSYQPHRARYVDPNTGAESRIIVVPAAQSESWQDGYSCFGTPAVDALAPKNDPNHPMLLLLAHDGDNAFGGGYSYYMECTPNFLSAASQAGYVPSTVEDYLTAHPIADNDIVHVESGAWVNADGDFGAPSFLNWNWPLVNKNGQVDLPNGWAEDERNWAIITAATNHVLTAQAVAGAPDPARVFHPEQGANQVEHAWHYLLGSLNSGYMYYGKVLDMELKPTVACNEAIVHAKTAYGSSDPVGPTLWLPQRYPDNPGGKNFGPLYGYKEILGPSDFWVWTFAHDVSGVASATLYVRADDDGILGPNDTVNHTYAGGAGVGAWKAIPMTRRSFPKGNLFKDPEVDTSILPTDIADEFFAQVTGTSETLLDYYVAATDTKGHTTRSPIQHVYVGQQQAGGGETTSSSSGGTSSSSSSSSSTSGGDPHAVHWTPPSPDRSSMVTVFVPEPGVLHWGVNGWQVPDASYLPSGNQVINDGKAVETPLAGPDSNGFYTVALGPFSAGDVSRVDFVVRRLDGSWDNNASRDYHVIISAGAPGPGSAGNATTAATVGCALVRETPGSGFIGLGTLAATVLWRRRGRR